MALFSRRPDPPPVLFHQLDVIGGQAGCDVGLAIREAIKGLTEFATFAV
jgi:hypothetical protein